MGLTEGRRDLQSGALLWLALLACSPAAETGQSIPNILLVTFDTARADRFGAYGYEKGRTPNFDRLASEGVLFELAIAPTPLTLPSHTSILTGVYPTEHGIHINGGSALSEKATLLSEVFAQHGWRTGAFVGSSVLDPLYGLEQGFEVYRDPKRRGVRAAYELSARAVTEGALEWVSSIEDDSPLFVWVHFYDPHFPYAAKPKRFKDIADPYDQEIAHCDAQLGRLVRALERRQSAHPLLTVVTADHGESLGEHGERTHGLLIYQSTLRVPLVFSGAPLGEARGTRVAHPVSSVALAPTLLQLAGLPASAMPDTRFAPLLGAGGASPPTRDDSIYFENWLPHDAHRWRAGRGLVWKEWKLIEGRPPQLYSLLEDPFEQRDLAQEKPELVLELMDRLEEFVRAHPSLDWRDHREIGAEEGRLLESLGYWETREGEDPYDFSLPDIRDRMDDLEALREAKILIDFAEDRADDPFNTAEEELERERHAQELLAQAAALIIPIHERNPGSPAIARRLLKLATLRGDDERVAELLEEIVSLGVGSSSDRFRLALLHAQFGQKERAIKEMEALVSGQPDFVLPYEWLASHYREAGEFDLAVAWAQRLVESLDAESPNRLRAESLLAATKAERVEGETASSPHL